MYSAEGEEVQLSFSIYPSNNVEAWLLEVEGSMKASVRDIIEQAIKAYPTVSAAFAWQPPECSLIRASLPQPASTCRGSALSSCCLPEGTLESKA